jgi:DNA repair exonuclease SbcCD ATPase subunit
VSDIVERLRNRAETLGWLNEQNGTRERLLDAADEIERLRAAGDALADLLRAARAEIVRLRAAGDALAEWLLRIVPDQDRDLNDALTVWEESQAERKKRLIEHGRWVNDLIEKCTTLTADLAAERAEIERLRQWKAEATTVLTQWFDVADQIVQELDFDDTIGRRKTDIVADEFVRLRAEVERLRVAGDALAEVADEWPELAEAWREVRR